MLARTPVLLLRVVVPFDRGVDIQIASPPSAQNSRSSSYLQWHAGEIVLIGRQVWFVLNEKCHRAGCHCRSHGGARHAEIVAAIAATHGVGRMVDCQVAIIARQEADDIAPGCHQIGLAKPSRVVR